ncbi:aromatic-ring-hydroxylating dioxygenase subunit beta [Parasphingorhabdus sp.]|uniref:aromatic-ring-hydroxylating dioxygenase subunit beta n=1 Tax=Parasphingorhabdus sp. TaxID=2709688 RepID=UPI0032660974
MMMTETDPVSEAILRFYHRYDAALDDRLLDEWPNFFADDGLYRITTRENWDGGYPLSTVLCEGVGMMRDRAVAIQTSMTYTPRAYRRFQSGTLVLDRSGIEVETRSNFLVLETLPDRQSQVAYCGVSYDRIRLDGPDMRFSKRVCVLDTEMISNSLIYPI